MSKSFEQLGCSKINIGLAITGKREDGYHNIDSIFQSIRLSDSIYFAKHHSVVFSGGAPELPEYMQKLVTYGEENLALKALRAIQAYTGCKAGAAIHLLKRVPIQAGLGGGSADAAAMLVGLNRFWDLRLTQEELLQIGATLGSDVPFLLQGGTARGTGRGEILTYGKSPDPHWLLLVKPKVSVSTAVAYGRFTNKSIATKQTIDTVQQHLENNDLKSAFLTSANTFEELLFPDHEELVICKEFFTSRGYPTIMTGSGPTMVVLLDKPMEALQLQEEIKAAGYDWLSLITKTCTQEDLP
ncbi:4-(cytidine 5'-diphospho)-2-C-methyl-D-erythritol kinase [Veillonella dispar]|uniref:4-(cytidine 5'-diphospho)-2-C-methyl-D-erythritol kinase n=1 Tax=Veillonella sp. TaxID=1926307 RepID=UPI00135D607F|nr:MULTISPECIES: 4-(cytidine 5'-diphospho)-2-C-methyl-D-erythritol kinase [Veillonella]MTH37906.1 4-(cytidine 5'-diphospho)-2-C-methyl-D-erythritol kinase [Veillonella dispar]MDK7738719.1 4-(cytidine 5'-diphospho)-2-C-methyl-D-erythritol kinase [Veillonella nakazawae]MDU2903804.1 4-(cytidine 5'-diphospho)-2-C-methyl-D-erythritol kinase [Veillonella sp.]MDU2964565.1 4-(cytidine 5'-diphospho)-2-C-methyl-D-erythritol kinase [Veillonella sp.]MDU4757223.1 4-(cytidine 5'-diphospho)-2-C-methyl-D-eryt